MALAGGLVFQGLGVKRDGFSKAWKLVLTCLATFWK
jgi:hypothetical protein